MVTSSSSLETIYLGPRWLMTMPQRLQMTSVSQDEKFWKITPPKQNLDPDNPHHACMQAGKKWELPFPQDDTAFLFPSKRNERSVHGQYVGPITTRYRQQDSFRSRRSVNPRLTPHISITEYRSIAWSLPRQEIERNAEESPLQKILPLLL